MRFLAHQTRARQQSWMIIALFFLLLGALLAAWNLLLSTSYYLFSFHQLFGGEPLKHTLVFSSIGFAAIILGATLYEYFTLKSQGAISIALQLGGTLLHTGRQPTLAQHQCLNIVQEMAIAAGHSMPYVYLLQNETSVNAFAAGYNDHYVIGITQGAIDQLSREQLQGIVAHEMSHIVEGDASLNLNLASLNYGLTAIYNLGCALTHHTQWQPSQRVDLLAWAIRGLGYMGLLAGRVLQAAVSREREYLADAGAVKLTRNPLGLSSALLLISKQMRSNKELTTLHSPLSEAFGYAFFSAAHATAFDESHWFDTHPPIKERIRRLVQG